MGSGAAHEWTALHAVVLGILFMIAIVFCGCGLFPGATDKVRSMDGAFLPCCLLDVEIIKQSATTLSVTLCIGLSIKTVYFFARLLCIFRARLNAR